MYSRLESQREKTAKRQSFFLIGLSIIIFAIFLLYGFPVILNFTGTISGIRQNNITNKDNQKFIPATPHLSQDLEATKSAQLTLKGVADSETSVEIFQNDKSIGTTVTKTDGSFSFVVDLTKGPNTFTVIAISQSGQKSPSSDPFTINLLISPPKLEIFTPKENEATNIQRIQVTGKTETNISVTINDRLATTLNDGNFSFNLDLTAGDNKIKIIATDKAGNQNTKEITVKYQP